MVGSSDLVDGYSLVVCDAMKTQSFFDRIRARAAQIIPEDTLIQKLASGKKLRIKLGMDPTAPDLHLGHAVVLSLLKQFQQEGHEVIFLVGDFTACIGDPTGKSKTRPRLSRAEIAHNMQTYLEQVGKILDAQHITIAYNATWLDALTSKDLVTLCAQVTTARILERDDFATRIEQGVPVGMHELLYPLLQGYDSVALKADVELGGTDQTFNLLMGRFLQEQYKQEAQVIITVPLLLGLDGVHKMSKSLGNAIGISEPADQAFGKLMSISDELMWHYAHLLLQYDTQRITQLRDDVAHSRLHPMAVKKEIAHAIVALYWSAADAQRSLKQFEALFQKKDYSQATAVSLPEGTNNPLWVIDLLRSVGAIQTSSEGKRLIEAGGLMIDGQLVTDFKAEITWREGTTIKAGKHRIYRIE